MKRKFNDEPKEFKTYVTDPETVKFWNDFEKEHGSNYFTTPDESDALCEKLESEHENIDLIHVDVLPDCLVIKHRLKGKI